MTESSGHKPTLTTTASQSISLADQVKHLEMRLEKLKSRQPAATKEELQKVEMYLTEKRKALAAEQTMIEKRKTRQK